HSPVTCHRKHSVSDATYYTTASGAGVFDTGTIEWVRALESPDSANGVGPASVAFARKVTLNLLTALAAGPLGHTHPAIGNLAFLHNQAGTATGLGGPVGR
ncbi:MAG TPA: hypothetical protein VG497_31605, partial [Kribbella sp.]|nr:hypothetical protein [Kribbella sp.]